MKVLKFGGTSVASSNTIKQTLAIIGQASKNDQIFVVVSALGGVTDMLLETARLAANKDEAYQQHFSEIEKKTYRSGKGTYTHNPSKQGR